MHTVAVLLSRPRHIALGGVELIPPEQGDVVVAVEWSGISAGTERLLWSGEMPPFPGLGYPLVPGYEAVGRIVAAPEAPARVGQRVFVPGARCYRDARGLFGASAARLVVPAGRALPVDEALGADATLLALAATARHALAPPMGATHPELIVGHGVLGRLLARLTVAGGAPPPTVWEREASRRGGAEGYAVVDPETDPRRDYRTVVDASGDPAILDTLIQRLAPGGEIVLAGFYAQPVAFGFPAAFAREMRLRVAAQWREPDLAAVAEMVSDGRLSLAGLVSHRGDAADAEAAYRTAFEDPGCLKMVLDWRRLS